MHQSGGAVSLAETDAECQKVDLSGWAEEGID
jgi:hypothetical protein